MPTISVVIPCLNEEKYLPQLLKCLMRQTVRADEVIVADSDSDDATLEIAREFKDKLPIKALESAFRSPGAARNKGASAAKGEYLLFIDADISIPDNFIEKIRSVIEVSGADFITPKYKSDGKNLVDSFLFWTVNAALYIQNRIFKKLFAIGGVICVRRSLHDRIGGFDTKMQAQNDIDYIHRLKKERPTFVYINDLVAIHSSRRYRGENTIQSLLALLRENSAISRWFIQPVLQKRGRGKKYGHHDH